MVIIDKSIYVSNVIEVKVKWIMMANSAQNRKHTIAHCSRAFELKSEHECL